MSPTRKLKIDPSNPDEKNLRIAADVLNEGGLVILPTETVYGIAADRKNKEALDKLWQVKKRPQDKKFSLLIEEKARVEEFCGDIPVAAYKLMDKFWPGPLTLVLKDKGGEGTLGLRMPDHKVALRVVELTDAEVVCPSANISGKPAAKTFAQAIEDMDGLVELAIDSGDALVGIESTVVDLSVVPLRVIREGAVKKAQIEEAANKKIVLFVCSGNSCRSVMAQGLLQKKIEQLGRKDVEVLSAGTMMMRGLGATEETKELLLREGVDMSSHRSRQVDNALLNKSDLILVMEKYHEERILQIDPAVRKRLYLLKEFANAKDNDLEITDPIGMSLEFYEETFETIKESIERISQII